MKSFEYEKPLNGRHIYSSSDNHNSRDLREDDPHLAEGSTTGIQATETRLRLLATEYGKSLGRKYGNLHIFVFIRFPLSLSLRGWMG